jgi:hypothetical protein
LIYGKLFKLYSKYKNKVEEIILVNNQGKENIFSCLQIWYFTKQKDKSWLPRTWSEVLDENIITDSRDKAFGDSDVNTDTDIFHSVTPIISYIPSEANKLIMYFTSTYLIGRARVDFDLLYKDNIGGFRMSEHFPLSRVSIYAPSSKILLHRAEILGLPIEQNVRDINVRRIKETDVLAYLASH